MKGVLILRSSSCRGPAGTACGHWTGVRLADVLEHCGVRNAVQAGRHVCFRGPKHELPQGAPPAPAGARRCGCLRPAPSSAAWHPDRFWI